MRLLRKSLRFPLPLKVLLSYLLVVTVGAVPTFVYLQRMFEQQLTADAAARVGTRAQLLANLLSGKKADERLHEVQRIAAGSLERVTYVATNGQVLFDSTTPNVQFAKNHLDRPEIQQALGFSHESEGIDLHLANLGIARRVSETTNVDSLYLASCVLDEQNHCNGILRLAIPIADVQDLTQDMLRVFRNSQAAAVTVAILLSLAAAVVFMRPLQQLAKRARAMAGGDYTLRVEKLSRNDEIGDVARALGHLGEQLRKRLAGQQSQEGVLKTLVDDLRIPMALWAQDGTLMAANAALRAALVVTKAAQNEAALQIFSTSGVYRDAAAAAQRTGDAVPLVYHQQGNESDIVGTVHMIEQPSSAPLFIFCGAGGAAALSSRVPNADDVEAISLPRVLQRALAQAHIEADVGARFIEAVPSVLVSDVQQRVQLALVLIFTGSGKNMSFEAPLTVAQTRTHVVLSTTNRLPDSVADMVNYSLAPLGGSVRIRRERSEIVLSKA